MNNPYLDEFHEIGNDGWHVRGDLVRRYAWAIPDKNALKCIANLGVKIVEIGAGRGYWAYMLAQLGVDIVAYDYRPIGSIIRNHYIDWRKNENMEFPYWFDVKSGGANKIKLHQDRALMLCWPEHSSTMAYNCLKAYKGNTVIYIGESSEGCTGTDEFFELLDYEYKKIGKIEIPQWQGIHDNLYIYGKLDSK